MARLKSPVILLGKRSKYPIFESFLSEEHQLLDFIQLLWFFLGFLMLNALFLASWDHNQLIKFRVFSFLLTVAATAVVSTFPALVIVAPFAKALCDSLFGKSSEEWYRGTGFRLNNNSKLFCPPGCGHLKNPRKSSWRRPYSKVNGCMGSWLSWFFVLLSILLSVR